MKINIKDDGAIMFLNAKDFSLQIKNKPRNY